MAEVETNYEDNISENFSTFDDKEEDFVVPGEVQQDRVDDILIQQDRVDDILMPTPTTPLVDVEPTEDVEESSEVLPTLTLNGVEEANVPGNDQDTDGEVIVNGFPAHTKPGVNDLITTTTPEGFEEISTGTDEKPLLNGSATTMQSLRTASSGAPEEFKEPNTEADEKPQANGLASTTPLVPTLTNGAPGGLEELDTGIDEKPVNDKKDGTLRSPLAQWIMKQNLHPEVVRLIYWVELQRTTGVFGGVLLLLLSLKFYSLLGVAMTFALSLLVVAFLYRIGMTIVKAVQKTSAEHPFKHLLEEKIEISEEAMQYWSSKTRQCINEGIRQTQSLFLVRDTVASLKAMIMFWLISYIASCIDFVSICIVGTVILFTVPKVYEEKQKEIDQLYSLVKERSCLACQMIEDKLPEKVKVYLKKTKCE